MPATSALSDLHLPTTASSLSFHFGGRVLRCPAGSGWARLYWRDPGSGAGGSEGWEKPHLLHRAVGSSPEPTSAAADRRVPPAEGRRTCVPKR